MSPGQGFYAVYQTCVMSTRTFSFLQGSPIALLWPISGAASTKHTELEHHQLSSLKTSTSVRSCASRQRKGRQDVDTCMAMFGMRRGAFCERADVIPEIHDQWAASVGVALSAHKSATQPVGRRAGEIDAIPVTSNCQKLLSHGRKTVMATTVVHSSRRSHGYL